jgi:hypothetical protein
MAFVPNDVSASLADPDAPAFSYSGSRILPHVVAIPSDSEVRARLESFQDRAQQLVELLRDSVDKELRDLGQEFPVPVLIETVRLRDGIRVLAESIQGQMQWTPDGLQLEVPELNLVVAGENVTSLQEELFEELDFLVDKFAMASDSELSPSGAELKAKLKSVLGV